MLDFSVESVFLVGIVLHSCILLSIGFFFVNITVEKKVFYPVDLQKNVYCSRMFYLSTSMV